MRNHVGKRAFIRGRVIAGLRCQTICARRLTGTANHTVQHEMTVTSAPSAEDEIGWVIIAADYG